MELLVLKFHQAFNAPKGDISRSEDVTYRSFKEGDEVEGYQHPEHPELVVVLDEYIVPAAILEILGDAQDINGNPEQDNSTPVDVSHLPPEFQAQLDKIINADPVGDIISKSTQSVTWLVGGGLAGFFWALIFKKPPLIPTVLGGLIFGVIGYNINIPAMNPKLLAEANPPKP